ncbi:hypothetical protein ACFQMA_13960 [Halosimplex aquaticum]|uniref:Uncharacterized protein n=1 Tax=Halosimplex aquaticum TaxID=3026162 RepID=A0ABD5Y0K6_9EURY|nr:hypothetical protein [Halosimplex aquaticum]
MVDTYQQNISHSSEASTTNDSWQTVKSEPLNISNGEIIYLDGMGICGEIKGASSGYPGRGRGVIRMINPENNLVSNQYATPTIRSDNTNFDKEYSYGNIGEYLQGDGWNYEFQLQLRSQSDGYTAAIRNVDSRLIARKIL